jgi:Homing endonuclease associated repeat
MIGVTRKPFRAATAIDPEELARFQAGLRRRYTDAQILEKLRASAERLGCSPTMKEFGADPDARVHPQTVIEHFGTWNAAKRAAGLMPRRFATRDELLDRLRRLGDELGRTPSAQDVRERRGSMPSASLYWHTFGSFTTALREAGFDVAVGEERLERAIDQGCALARRLRRLPRFGDWQAARRDDPSLLTEWQVYRLFDSRRGAWGTFQYLVGQRLREQGATVGVDGTVA